MHPFCAGATILGAILHAEIKLNADPTRIADARMKLDLTTLRQTLGI